MTTVTLNNFSLLKFSTVTFTQYSTHSYFPLIGILIHAKRFYSQTAKLISMLCPSPLANHIYDLYESL